MHLDDKISLRAAMKARREAIPADRRAALAQALACQPVPGTERGPVVVSSYGSMGAELAPGPVESRLRGVGHTLCLPVMVGKAKPLVFRAWTAGDPMVERLWGIREPVASAPEVVPDVLMVPLLAFDRQGHRLGYGGGFYDRTLQALRVSKPILAIGLAYDEQEVDAVPHLDYDQPLDWVLTPSGPIRCTK